MNILAIETSCDETALALVKAQGSRHSPRFKILKSIISSQVKIHEPYGGVVPNLAKREHLKNLPLIWRKFSRFQKKVDLVTVTVGPGLEPALWAGITFAQKLSKEIKKPLRGANHLEGHLYSFLLGAKPLPKLIFPAVALIVSGGHTILLYMTSLTNWKKLGETRDDAAGEAFDKVARLLKLSYPGGPEIEKLATEGNASAINFPRPMIHTKDYEFSFSGLKTAVLYYLRDHKNYAKSDVAASFQEAVTDVLTFKLMRAARQFGARSVILTGGVAANQALKKRIQIATRERKLNFLIPPPKLNTDNAAMIAGAGYINYLSKRKYPLIAKANINL